jgi:hypothetical protein
VIFGVALLIGASVDDQILIPQETIHHDREDRREPPRREADRVRPRGKTARSRLPE